MKNSFESFGGTAIKKAHEEAELFLERDAMDTSSFIEIYGEDVIAEDDALVEKLKKRYREQRESLPSQEQDVHMLATIFEAVVHQHGELSEWFGSHATTIRVSEFDDFVNGIDELVEFEEGEQNAEHLALAIDLTTGADMRKKIDRITSEINAGQAAEIKYFESDHLDVKGKKINVPRVVIGADIDTVRELMELWLNKKMRELGTHPIAIQILEEIRLQADALATYARNRGQEKIAKRYEKVEQIILRVFREKNLVPGNTMTDLKQDGVFYSLHQHMKRISKLEE